ncbi:hypothetical protein AAC978_11735 [Desulfitobacterium sp. THU1]|uniref:hypothetical protein n=1 Tax=Desulfitobacterium sp. THU1 TaxID=3138072 RepID=UPI00311FC909
MRLALEVNPVKECQSCARRDEREVSAHILSYQIAHQLLSRVQGHIQVDGNFLILDLEGHAPLYFDLSQGSVRVKNLNNPLEQRYDREKAVDELASKIMEEAQINPSDGVTIDPVTNLLVKLIEIYHARCCLHIASVQVQGENTIWEIKLNDDGRSGWIQSNRILRNSFGEEINIDNWQHLRPEKLAMYVFGFFGFCSHYPSPMKQTHYH